MTSTGQYDPTQDYGRFRPNDRTVKVDSITGIQYTNGVEYPALVFAHEVKHALDFDNGNLDRYQEESRNPDLAPFFVPNAEEERAQQFEFDVATELGVFGSLEYSGHDSSDGSSDYVGPVLVDSPVPPVSQKNCKK